MATVWYWLFLVAYFVVILWIGLTVYRVQKKKETAQEEHDDYWIRGRKTSALLVGMSIAAGWLLLGFITWAIYAAYMYGVGGVWAMVAPWSLLLFAMVILVPWVRRIKAISQPQMLQARFGLALRVLVSPWNIIAFTVWSAAEVWTVSQYISPKFGVEPWAMYIIFSAPIAIYMWMGGFHAVLNSNIIQFFMSISFVTIVLIVMAVLVSQRLPEGQSFWGYLQEVVPPGSAEGDNGTSLFTLGIPFIFVSIIALLPGWVIEEDWWLKAQSAESTPAARRGIWANLVYNFIWVLGAATVIGLMALVIYPPSEAFDSVLGGDAYNIMPVFLTTEFPDWALVIMFGLLAALVMSTVATFTNVCALNLSYDILQPLVYRKRGWSDSRIVFFSRFASLIMVALAVAVAFGIDYLPTGLWDAYYISSGLLSAGVAVPVLAMFWKRATFAGAFAGSLVGAILAFVFYMLEYYVFEFVYWPQWLADTALGYCVVAVIGGTLTLIVVSLLTPKSPQEKLDAISAQPVDDHEEFFAGVRAHGG